MENNNVELGFAEKFPEDFSFDADISLEVPSKMGGQPWWVAPTVPRDLQCSGCAEPLAFLCQLFVPIENPAVEGENVNKLMYVFVCTSCQRGDGKKAVRVFRVQYKESYAATQKFPMCALCGCAGDKKCSGCGCVYYCSRKHQVLDWKYSHKQRCKDNNNSSTASSQQKQVVGRNPVLFDEHEIVIETEPNKDERLKFVREKYKVSYPEANKTDEQLERDLIKVKETKVKDEHFLDFKERIECEPTQVVRYDLGGQPLWVSGENLPSAEEIPPCETCGSERQFEFQVMPQMLNYLGIDTKKDSIDWGTLIVYTCTKDCMSSEKFVCREGFVYSQPFSKHDVYM